MIVAQRIKMSNGTHGLLYVSSCPTRNVKLLTYTSLYGSLETGGKANDNSVNSFSLCFSLCQLFDGLIRQFLVCYPWERKNFLINSEDCLTICERLEVNLSINYSFLIIQLTDGENKQRLEL